MEAKHNHFNFKLEPKAAEELRPRQTFILPFVVLSFLSLPSLLVLALGKSSSNVDALASIGYLSIVKVLLWILVPLATVFGVLYLIRGKHTLGRLGVLFMMLAVMASFIYFIWPES